MVSKYAKGVLCLIVVFFSSFPAHAGSPYAGLTVGLAYLNDSSIKGSKRGDLSYDEGEAYSYAHGLDFGSFRFEGEIGYQKNDFETFEPGGIAAAADGDLSILSLLANGYYSCHIGDSRIVPIISAGIGAANVEYEDEVDEFSEDDIVLAYQVGAGLGVKISSSVSVNAMYRYFATQDAGFREDEENIELDISSHNVLVGLKVDF
ncbi:outer membrane beta-barrel protein [Prosthecochloris sp.]|uniref:outer membrane protein n=1 Tax=Prosthecochloris sp. TaxID=290513 RepID=UPI0025DFB821|nr:outer membrane beta-barrel protein [Prosthecochloris sp.]